MHRPSAASALATDAGGHLFVGGEFLGNIAFGGTASVIAATDTVEVDGFVAKLDASGNPVWSRLLVTPYFAFGNVDALGFTEGSNADPGTYVVERAFVG